MAQRSSTELATLLLVTATFALDCFSTFTSSPQTTELAAEERGDTISYWVAIGSAVAVGGGVLGSSVSGSAWPLVVTVAAAGAMWLLYTHAAHRGEGQLTPDTVA